MKREEIKQALIDSIIETTNEPYGEPTKPEDIKDTDSFMDDLCLDSLDIVDMTIRLEKKLNISVPDEELEAFGKGTIASTVDYLETIVR